MKNNKPIIEQIVNKAGGLKKFNEQDRKLLKQAIERDRKIIRKKK